jgi:hypothetical protein
MNAGVAAGSGRVALGAAHSDLKLDMEAGMRRPIQAPTGRCDMKLRQTSARSVWR